MREIHSFEELTSFLKSGNSLKDTVVQSVDVTQISAEIVDATIDNTVFLGAYFRRMFWRRCSRVGPVFFQR